MVNKVDLDSAAERLGRPYRAAGYDVLLTSVPGAIGIDELARRLEDKISLFTGPTGVGKSSLLNAVQPGLGLRTGAVSHRTRTGRHTTVAAEMYRLDRGGFVVDTPGLRDIGIWSLTPQEVEASFPEFAGFASACRFDNCRHLQEPGCAVVEATERGDVYETRLKSYRRFLEEALQAARHWE